MKKFLSGMGMGVVAGACLGLAVAGLMTEGERRQLKRRAHRAVRAVEDAAAGLGLGGCCG